MAERWATFDCYGTLADWNAGIRELGIRRIWINRLGEQPGPEPARELPDLTLLSETLAELAPA